MVDVTFEILKIKNDPSNLNFVVDFVKKLPHHRETTGYDISAEELYYYEEIFGITELEYVEVYIQSNEAYIDDKKITINISFIDILQDIGNLHLYKERLEIKDDILIIEYEQTGNIIYITNPPDIQNLIINQYPEQRRMKIV